VGLLQRPFRLLVAGLVDAEGRHGGNIPLFIKDWVNGGLKIPPGPLIFEANWFARANNFRHILVSIGGYLRGHEGEYFLAGNGFAETTRRSLIQ
jgi:hypothetical protein